MKLLLSTILLIILIHDTGMAQQPTKKVISKNDIIVHWFYIENRIYFEISAPTKGWIAIGVNESPNLTGTYWLMGHIIKNKPNAIEYSTLRPGNYKPIASLTEESTRVKHLKGVENEYGCHIQFSLPVHPTNRYHKNLVPGAIYTLHLAYSESDDFDHHSRIRTHININF